ncbi:hypothetical protein D3C77_498070 [compost metagenome]
MRRVIPMFRPVRNIALKTRPALTMRSASMCSAIGAAGCTSVVPVTVYEPCLRRLGNTSPVTHFLKRLASGLRLLKIRL